MMNDNGGNAVIRLVYIGVIGITGNLTYLNVAFPLDEDAFPKCN